MTTTTLAQCTKCWKKSDHPGTENFTCPGCGGHAFQPSQNFLSAFERYTMPIPRKAPWISIGSTGLITLSQPAAKDLPRSLSASFFYDRETKRIAIQFHEKQEHGAFSARFSRDRYTIPAKFFFLHFSIPIAKIRGRHSFTIQDKATFIFSIEDKLKEREPKNPPSC